MRLIEDGTYIVDVSGVDLDDIKRVMLEAGTCCTMMYPDKESSYGWCTDCKEYDQEAHCCHRFSSVIRKTIDEFQLVRCKDCENYNKHDKRCKVWNHGVDEWGFCYKGEPNDRCRRT